MRKLLEALGIRPSFSAADRASVIECGQRLTAIINESIEIAGTTKKQATLESRVRVAEEKLEELKNLCNDYPFLSMPNLDDVEVTLIRLRLRDLK